MQTITKTATGDYKLINKNIREKTKSHAKLKMTNCENLLNIYFFKLKNISPYFGVVYIRFRHSRKIN